MFDMGLKRPYSALKSPLQLRKLKSFLISLSEENMLTSAFFPRTHAAETICSSVGKLSEW
jgi:hypothetical protein